MIRTKSAHAEYPDCHLPTDVEAFDYAGHAYVGINVCPRGFANEFSVYAARADDAEAVKRLQCKIDRSYTRQPGDSYNARWLTATELRRHIYSMRDGDTGYAYLLTLDANNNTDSLRI